MAKVAAEHYSVYPQGAVKPVWAYAFRPLFIILPVYMTLSILLWLGYFLGWITLPFINNALHWHIFELLFGMGSAGTLAFMLTAVPEMFPGAVPVVGKKLQRLIILWLLGRMSFWFMDFTGVYLTAMLNIALLCWLLVLVYQPILRDRNRRHISLLVALFSLLVLQIWYFAATVKFVDTDNLAILYLVVSFFMILILLVLQRVSIEVVNAFLQEDNYDEVYFSRPPRYNLAIFIIILFAVVEFLFPHNSVLGWLGLACGAAILNILNDFILDNKKILLEPMIALLISIYLLMALGYSLMGYDYLYDGWYGINHFRHFLTTGAFSMSFYLVMVIVSTVHTGRELSSNVWINIGGGLLILASILRSLIVFFPQYSQWLYSSSGILWLVPFLIYLWQYFRWLISVRLDGMAG